MARSLKKKRSLYRHTKKSIRRRQRRQSQKVYFVCGPGKYTVKGELTSPIQMYHADEPIGTNSPSLPSSTPDVLNLSRALLDQIQSLDIMSNQLDNDINARISRITKLIDCQ